MEIEKQKLESRSVNYVSVAIRTESGCDPKEDEYSMEISGFTGFLDISSPGGTDDIELIKECIRNDFDFDSLPEEGITEVILVESGEWEDVFWHKYYEIQRVAVIFIA